MRDTRSEDFARGLDAYREEVSAHAPPDPVQIEQFVEFVADSHSWYKHLPRFATRKFWFFLNPVSGMNCLRDREGNTEYRERTDDDESKFHYTWMTTADYRARFGILDYYTEMGSRFVVGGETHVAVVGPHSRPLPSVIVEAGQVDWSATVHRLSCRADIWAMDLASRDQEGLEDPAWPEESGGAKIFREIRRVVQSVDIYSCEDGGYESAKTGQINDLIFAERHRQKKLALDAIGRVVGLVYPGAETQRF